MSQSPQDMMDQQQKVPNQVVHIRSDSETKLDELFNAVIRPKDYQAPLTVPMRLRNLPPSFFQQPDKTANDTKVQVNHPRAHSSPASLQQGLSKLPPVPPTHTRQRSYGDLLDDPIPLPAGWEMAKTSAGQTYFLNHVTQTTTWVDPRKKIPPASLGPLPKGWEQATTLEGEVYFINHIDRSTSWLDPRIPAHLQNPPLISSPVLPQQTAVAQASVGRPMVSGNVSLQQRQQNLRVQSLEMEREQLRLRQQEIMRQQELLLRQSLGEKLSLAATPDLPLDSFVEGSDFHSRQESADSGLGLGTNYSLPHTPEDFLNNLDDLEDRQSNDLGLDLQTTLDLGDDNMDTDDLVPSLQEELNADIMSDVEALLAANKDSVLTWL